MTPNSATCDTGLPLSEVLACIASHPALTAAALNLETATAIGHDAGKRGPDELFLGTENIGGDLPGYSDAETTLTWRRPIVETARARAARKSAAQARKAMIFETERIAWRLSIDAQVAFHKALGLRDLTVTAGELVVLTEELARAARERVNVGVAPENEAIKADMELTRARTEQRHVIAEFAQAKIALGRAIGRPFGAERPLVGTLTPDLALPDRNVLLKGLLERHPVFREENLALEENAVGKEKLRAEQRPELAFETGIRNLRADRKMTFVMGVTASLPNHSASTGALTALSLQRKRIELESGTARLTLEAELDEWIARFAAARETALDLRDRILPAARNVFSLAMDGYRLGKTDQLSALEARKSLLETQRELQHALDDLYQSASEIERMCGICLVGEAHESTRASKSNEY
ncbi:MAG: TolC family protein [Candidatus Riflebacteria bacterium]|nr:TolC family protein [Candidatus Riflebacteria bacterium]